MTDGYPGIVNASDAFEVQWRDEADAGLTWLWDQMHCPRPVSPLGADVFGRWMGLVMGGKRAVVNGFIFNSFGGPPPPRPAPTDAADGNRSVREVWEEVNQPAIREICDWLRTNDWASRSLAELGGELEEIVARATRAFAYTFGAAIGFFGPTNALIDFCEHEIGAEGPLRAATLLQGVENESASAGLHLGRLAELAAGLPAVATALRDERFDAIEGVEGGGEFLAALRGYLDEYGWRAETWAELHKPTWAEDPTVALRLVRRYLVDPERSPAAARRRAIARREEAVREIESRLEGEALQRFRDLLAAAREHVPVSEGRALWQLITAGLLRIPFLTLGRKLVESGLADRPDDVFYLHLDELQALARGEGARDTKAEVARRRADHARWGALIPPRYLGAPPPRGLQAALSRFFGLGVTATEEAGIVNGIAASRGTARGTTRVILDLADADRLQAGDILVCPSTAPPWTPLFAIAAAVVTDSGGVLSHTAICAREYGIPAVVGTLVATQKIPDGATVTVDGAQGIVRIEA